MNTPEYKRRRHARSPVPLPPPSGPTESAKHFLWSQVVRLPLAVRLVIIVGCASITTYFALPDSLQRKLDNFTRIAWIRLRPVSEKARLDAKAHAQLAKQSWRSMESTSSWEVVRDSMSKALVEYEIAEAEHPSNSDYVIGAGAALNRLGRYGEAAVKIDRAIELECDPPAWYYNEMCVALENLKQWREAEAACRESVRKDTRNAKFRQNLANFLATRDAAASASTK